ncbi:MAG TPA: hypothetical protein VGP41_17790 [Candidatus Lustribacter sp.]|nr:hypothetical protein [Candidatus Lustribacter sp.]
MAAVIAGCGASQNATAYNSLPTPVPTPTTPCTSPPGFQIQMVFPQNNATSQPNLQGVVFAVAPSPLPTNWFVYATSIYGNTYGSSSIGFLATAAPSATPFPTPSDTPLFPPAVYESTSIGTFANANSTFTILLANSTCYPGVTEGTFTTSLTDSPTATPSPTGT